MISNISFLNGICALVVLITAGWAAIISLRTYKETQTKNFLNLTVLAIAIIIGWSGITISFLSVLIFGVNDPNLILIVNITSFIPEPIGAFAVINSNWSVFGSPDRKKSILTIYAIFSAIYYVVLFLTFNQAIVCPGVPPGEILNNWASPTSLFYYIFWVLIFISVIITSVGFIKFSRKYPGELKRKSYYIIIASLCVGLGILLDTVIFMNATANFDFISRILLIPGMIFIYLGFRPLK